MTNPTPDPREDALAKAREAMKIIRTLIVGERIGAAIADLDNALAALSVQRSQSESDDEIADAMEEAYAEARFNGPPEKAIRAALAVARKALTPSPTDYVRPAALSDLWRDLCEKGDRTSPAEYPDMALITFEELSAIVAAANDVRPAAEIRAEIECIGGENDTFSIGWRSALIWSLTPPTQEPRR